jgi:prepilin-type N-terminal cleavage/methylation domain-containing protein
MFYEGVEHGTRGACAPHAARTSQRDVPATLKRYSSRPGALATAELDSPANKSLKKAPGEGTGPTIHAVFRGNLVGRVPSRGEQDVFEQTANRHSGLSALQGFVGSSCNEGTHRRAFTLVEIIAVVAIIAVLAAAIVPTIIRRLDRATWTRETADLNAIADSLKDSIVRNKIVPGTNNWATAIATQMSLPVSAITTNSRRYARAFLIDPAFQIGSNVAGQIYTQTNNGATSVSNARVMIVSSLGRALPAIVTSGVPLATNFTAIWNAAENTVPTAPAFSGWGGTGEDLRIKKLNLETLFYRLILVNHTSDTNSVPRYSIDNSSAVFVPSGPLGLDRYYLDSTVVGLHDGTANATVQSRHLLKRNISFLFESDAWRGQVQGDQQSYSASGADFYNHAITFFNHQTNPHASSGGSQYGVMIAMYTFMFDYTYWANECPHFSYHNNGINSVPEYKLLENQGQNNGNISSFSLDLINP